MDKQEIKEVIAEIRHSDMPEQTKKVLVNMMYEKRLKESEDANEKG